MIPLSIICTALTLYMIARLILKDLKNHKPMKTKQEIIQDIINNVSEASGIDVKTLKSKTRKREVVIARQFAMYEIKNNFGQSISWKQVAEVFGKDHATAIHSYRTTENAIETNDIYVRRIIDNYQSNKNIAA